MLPIADGSDTGGSLRNPASFSNVVGMRPSPGRVPNWPSRLAWSTLSTSGPMARTVEDLALLYRAMAGPDSRAPLSIEQPPSLFQQPLGRDFRGVRVAWSPDLGGLPLDPQVRRVLDAQRATLEALGCIVEDVAPDFSDADEIFHVLRAMGFALQHAEQLERHRDLLKDTIIWNTEEGLKLTGRQIMQAISGVHEPL
jgi:amidase